MSVFFAAVFGLYFVGLAIVLMGWYAALPQPATSGGSTSLKVSVVVPFRNEEKNLANLIRDIQAQRNVTGRMEVILVDDHSTDHSLSLASGLVRSFPEFKILSMPVGKEGKKQAITEGIQLASGHIIATTDADCRLPDGWLMALHHRFLDGKIKMVFGGVRMKDDGTFFSRLLAEEFCSLVGTAAATAGLGMPILCNAASLAFTKAAFVSVGGYEGNFDVASGDDEFLLHKIHRQFPGSVTFLADSQAVVETPTPPTFGLFMKQRLRWAGKWKRNNSLISKSVALFVLFFQLSFLLVWFFVPWDNPGPVFILSVLFLVGKFLLEFHLLAEVGNFLRVPIRLFDVFVLQFIYPFYVVSVGIASLFISPSWKGRR